MIDLYNKLGKRCSYFPTPSRVPPPGEENGELQRKHIFDLKRNLNDEIREKETVCKTAGELRAKVKATEAEKVDQSRCIQEMRQRVSSEWNRCLCVGSWYNRCRALRGTLSEPVCGDTT